MEIFVESLCKGKKFEPVKLVVRADQLVKKENLAALKDQVIDVLEKNSQTYVDKFIPGKFGKGEKYALVFVYSIIDTYNFEKDEWTDPQASIDLFEVRAFQSTPIIQTAGGMPPQKG